MPLIPDGQELKGILQEKWKCLSQCLDTATQRTICTLTGLVSQPGSPQVPSRHLVFTYGTLKRGEPNHFHFLNAENGSARLVGRATTVHAWPLIVTTKWNLPFLVWSEGHGKVVYGEVYEIDDKMLEWTDDFEGHPEVYQRDRLLVTLYDEQPVNKKQNHKCTANGGQQNYPWASNGSETTHAHGPFTSMLNAFRQMDQSDAATAPCPDPVGACAEGGRTIECWVYFLKHIRPSMLELPCYENYSSSDLENMEYDAEEEIQSIDDIMRALDEANL